MKKENIKRIESLVTDLANVCLSEGERDLNVLITNNLISVFNSPSKPRRERIDLFTNDGGTTWSDMR